MVTMASEAEDTIDALLARAIDSGGIPGFVAAATTGETVVFAKACGRRALDEPAAMTLDTVFRIESMTKAFTAVASLQAVERGLVTLDQNLGEILPALASPLVLEGFVDGRPMLRPATSPVTLRHLLTHTAGCAYEMWNERISAFLVHTGVSRDESFSRAEHALPLVSDPGMQWEYGVGMEWAGKILETLLGKPLDAIFEEGIFAPLGMASTGYTLRPDMRARLAACYQRGPDGALVAHRAPPLGRVEHLHGGGGSYSTASDYLRFLQMLLNRGTLGPATILQPESVGAFGMDQIGPLPVAPMRTAKPLLSNDFESLPGIRTGWGLGFEISLDAVPGRRRAGSFGWAGLRNTYYWVDPSTDVAGLLMAQVLPFGDPAVLAVYRGFEQAIYEGISRDRGDESRPSTV